MKDKIDQMMIKNLYDGGINVSFNTFLAMHITCLQDLSSIFENALFDHKDFCEPQMIKLMCIIFFRKLIANYMIPKFLYKIYS